jgi:hypothetical protein
MQSTINFSESSQNICKKFTKAMTDANQDRLIFVVLDTGVRGESIMNCKKCLTNFHACDIILKQCGYGGIGRRVWFSLRYDSGKITVLTFVRTVLCLY